MLNVNLLKIHVLAVHFVVTIIGNVQKMKPVQNCTGFIFCHIQRLYIYLSSRLLLYKFMP